MIPKTLHSTLFSKRSDTTIFRREFRKEPTPEQTLELKRIQKGIANLDKWANIEYAQVNVSFLNFECYRNTYRFICGDSNRKWNGTDTLFIMDLLT
jgi:hypothetical protein